MKNRELKEALKKGHAQFDAEIDLFRINSKNGLF